MATRTLSRTRSGLKHAVGDDEIPAVPAPNEMQAVPAPNEMSRAAPAISVKPLTLELVDAMTSVHNEGFGSKYACCCINLADNEGRIRKFYVKHPERLPMCGVAVGSDGTPLGFVQLAIYPMSDKDGLHSTKPGETYIEMIGVAAAARGKGIGTLLLQWAEAKAREAGSNFMTLTVLNGNPALRLYERFGFAVDSADPCDQSAMVVLTCCLMGRPYGLCDPHFGLTNMTKLLK